MANQIIVLVMDRGDPKHGEITVLDATDKAERLIETLLEAGFEQERIRVFAGNDIPMKVSYRPVVEIPGELRVDGGNGKASGGSGSADPAELPSAKANTPAAEAVSANGGSGGAVSFASSLRPSAAGATPQISLHGRSAGVIS